MILHIDLSDIGFPLLVKSWYADYITFVAISVTFYGKTNKDIE